jgi:polysaccharide pyruvyl transferase WcaK-like protein
LALDLENESTTGSEPRAGAGRIGLLGVFGTGNFGNDGSLEAMVRFLRRDAPEESLVCICTGPDVVRQELDLDSVPLYYRPSDSGNRLVRLFLKVAGRLVMPFNAVRRLRGLKVLILPGTGALDDFGVSPLGWPQDLMTWFCLARLMGVKVVLASIGAGPIHHPLSKFFFIRAARAAHYRSYRDARSRDYMAGLGLDVSRDPVVPDLAFALPPAASVALGMEPLTVGVGVMTYYGWQKGQERLEGTYAGYIEKITAYIAWLLERGNRVRLMIGDEIDKTAVDDILKALGVRNAAGREARLIYEPAHDLAGIMRQMADIDIAVATRYHNVVCALKMDRPMISIGYMVKNDVLLAAMGLGDYCQHIERLDVEQLKAQTLRLIDGRAEYAGQVRAVREKFERALQAQEQTLLAFIRK